MMKYEVTESALHTIKEILKEYSLEEPVVVLMWLKYRTDDNTEYDYEGWYGAPIEKKDLEKLETIIKVNELPVYLTSNEWKEAPLKGKIDVSQKVDHPTREFEITE